MVRLGALMGIALLGLLCSGISVFLAWVVYSGFTTGALWVRGQRFARQATPALYAVNLGIACIVLMACGLISVLCWLAVLKLPPFA